MEGWARFLLTSLGARPHAPNPDHPTVHFRVTLFPNLGTSVAT
jgi:hypothetical protein